MVVSLYRHGFPEALRPYPADRFNPAIDSRTDVVPGEAEPAPAAATASAGGVSAEAVFGEIAKRVEADPSLVQKVNAVYQFVVTSGSDKKAWTVDLKSGPKGKVTAGAAAGADCTLTLAEKDFVDLVQGKLDAQGAFLKGLLKVLVVASSPFAFFLSLTCYGRVPPPPKDLGQHGRGDEAEPPLRRQQEGGALEDHHQAVDSQRSA